MFDIDRPDLLFHYTRRDVVFEHIFDQRQLRLGLLRETRDPREAQEWQFRITGKGRSPFDKYTKEEVWQAARGNRNRLIKKGVEVLCLTKNLSPCHGYDDLDMCVQQHKESAGWARPRMWDQYGERHTGICLVLDKAQLAQSVLKSGGKPGIDVFHDSVRYSMLDEEDDMQYAFDIDLDTYEDQGPDEYLLRHRKIFYHEFFMRKHVDWRDEAEYRWICFDEDETPRYIDLNSLVAVIVGYRFPSAYKRLLRICCDELQVPAGEMGWKNGRPEPPRWIL
jgi:hypothetical protein